MSTDENMDEASAASMTRWPEGSETAIAVKPFYLVVDTRCHPRGHGLRQLLPWLRTPPVTMFPSIDGAQGEADRLARKHPGVGFVVMATVSRHECLPEPPPEGRPFAPPDLPLDQIS